MTLVIDDEAMRGVRELARREGRNLSDVVSEFLRDGLLRRRLVSGTSLKLPVYNMGRPRVNLADRDVLERTMEDT